MIGLPVNSLVDDLDGAGEANCCGQAAVATCVEHYRVGPLATLHGPQLVTEIYSRFPPDINPSILGVNLGNFGTWPQYIAQTIVPGVGLHATEFANNSGGNPENGITPQQWLAGAFDRQHPVICVLDVSKLWNSQPWFSCHYVVAYAADAPDSGNVYFTNGLGTSATDWPSFLNAWHVWFASNAAGMQGIQYAAIEVTS